ncbi:hypothetical protein OSB04_004265 [Centaurea solstitialis]|uniref:Exonuclease domain-containing protein n=1 Tax=Centaurea solstitialis TaxID=347529 RepID=A0AA38TY74_9ASTR|nr:hypothetical protein OSB04_004265 [Centaurea solstitialis]
MLVQEAFPAIITTPKCHGAPRSLQQFLFNIFQNANTFRKTTQIHTQIITNAFTQRNFIVVKLLQSYLSSGHLHQARRVFEQIDNPSTTSWNQIIRGYASSDTPRESIRLFDRMLASGEMADEYSYCYVINACARGKLLRFGEKFHGRVLAGGFCSNVYLQTGLVNLYAVVGVEDDGGVKSARKVFDEMSERNVVTWNTLLSGYVKCGDIDAAREVFDEMPERNIVSWTTLVSGCAHNGRCKEALSLFREMLHARMEFDHAILVAVLSACAEIGDLKTGRWIHYYVLTSSHLKNEEHEVRLNNALLHMYAGCGLIDDAYKLFKRMPVKTTVSWTTMISSFAKQGRGEDALNVFRSMETAKPDAVTILVVLNACSHSGFLEQGRRIFKNMSLIWGIKPEIEHYGCMVDLLSRAGRLEEALTLVESMPMDPNDAIWGAILGGCGIHKNVKLASLVAQKLASLNLDDDKVAGYLVLLSNIYAGAKRWKDVANAREKMVDLELRKAPGRSWVQIGGSVCEFFAGDTTHKRTSLIYEMLVLVTIEARLTGYEPDVFEAAQPYIAQQISHLSHSRSSGIMVSSVDRSEIAFFDLETTVPTRPGQGFAILEFGSILVCPRKLVELESYETLVRPHDLKLISTLSVRANGITADAVVSAPTFSDIADRVYDILHGRIWAGHNIIRFDCVRLREAFAQINRSPPEPKGTIDTLALLTQRFGRRAGDMKMASLAAYFGLGKQTHRSLDDVRMNLEVLKYCATVLFLESSLPDIFTENSWVSPNATTRNRSNARAALNGSGLTTSPPSSSRNIENHNSTPNHQAEEPIHPIFSLAASGAGEQVPNSVESSSPQPDPFNLGPLVDKIEEEILQSNEAMDEESSIAIVSNAVSESSDFLEPDEVSVPSVTVVAVPYFRGPQKIQILHREVALQMRCNSLRVRFGFSTKYVDVAGRPRLSIVVDAPPNLCAVLDACDDLANKRFVESDSDSEWRRVVSRKPGFYNFPTIRLQYDMAELQALIHPGSIIDAYFTLDPYDYQQNAGIRLVTKKLIIDSK